MFRDAAQRLALEFAMENGFSAQMRGKFIRFRENCEEWFVPKVSCRGGFCELEPAVGVDVPVIRKLLRSSKSSMVVAPILGGPLYRFADLRTRSLHDFIIEISDRHDVYRGRKKLDKIWNEVAVPLLFRLVVPQSWVDEVEAFLERNILGALNLVTVGRVCVCVMYASGGRRAAERALDCLAVRGGNGKPVQDFVEAQEMFSTLSESPNVLAELKLAVRSPE